MAERPWHGKPCVRRNLPHCDISELHETLIVQGGKPCDIGYLLYFSLTESAPTRLAVTSTLSTLGTLSREISFGGYGSRHVPHPTRDQGLTSLGGQQSNLVHHQEELAFKIINPILRI
jgi:hypothetical protein